MEGFNNVVVMADWDSYYYDEHYHEYIPYDPEQWPHLYCTDSLSEGCQIKKKKTDQYFEFLNSECICNGYQFPTAMPTSAPSYARLISAPNNLCLKYIFLATLELTFARTYI